MKPKKKVNDGLRGNTRLTSERDLEENLKVELANEIKVKENPKTKSNSKN